MDSLKVNAYAKVNLSLDIVGKRENGYHDVQMIMQTIRLFDRIEITKNETGTITTASNLSYVPNNETNLSYRAAKVFFDQIGAKEGIHIKMDKRIPVGGGLGGGSADAAAVLRGLNQMYGYPLSMGELSSLGATLGADVPFCLRRGTFLAEGIGEELSHLPPFPEMPIVLVKPPFGVSTKWVYQTLKWDAVENHPDTLGMIRSLSEKDPVSLASKMKNVLEEVVFPRYGVIRELKEKMKALGALGSLMSGSGATVFGIFETEEAAKIAYDAFRNNRYETYLTKTMEGK